MTSLDANLCRNAADEEFVGPTEHVEEARRRGQSLRVALNPPARPCQSADLGDNVAIDGKVADNWRTSIPRINMSMVDESIVHRQLFLL